MHHKPFDGTRWGNIQRSPDPLAGLRGWAPRPRAGEGKGKGKGWGERGRGGEGGRT